MGSDRRYLNVLVGGWLVASAFLWPHSQGQLTNTCASGLLCVVTAALSGAAPRFRLLNTAVAVWVLITAFSIPRIGGATLWNNVAVAVAMFVVSLLPASSAHTGSGGPVANVPG
jgi:hypothetical protein